MAVRAIVLGAGEGRRVLLRSSLDTGAHVGPRAQGEREQEQGRKRSGHQAEAS